ncbi:MAG: hypothetical protein IPM06_21020 [Rhizobiales bacterium]|nr:hypothetical protein [Hyphomicrobiales bacterium]
MSLVIQNRRRTRNYDISVNNLDELFQDAAAATEAVSIIAIEAKGDAAAARLRENHTGNQLASTISDLGEAVDDRVATLLVAGNGIGLEYDDTAGTIEVSSSGGSSPLMRWFV